VTFGEPLVAALPPDLLPLERSPTLRLFVGGAEVNFAVGMRRLGQKHWRSAPTAGPVWPKYPANTPGSHLADQFLSRCSAPFGVSYRRMQGPRRRRALRGHFPAL